MNKNNRKGKSHRNENPVKTKQSREDNPELRKRSPECKAPKDFDKTVRNRCCLVRPKQHDFGQITDLKTTDESKNNTSTENYSSLLNEQYGFDPVKSDNITRIKEPKIMFGRNRSKIENSSQYNEDVVCVPKFVETSDGTQWQSIDNINDIDKFIKEGTETEEAPNERNNMPNRIHISEVPKVKIIAEKFSKFKRDNVELRRLDEKVVCVEYDVFDRGSTSNVRKPFQALRAFFSVKPLYEDGGAEPPPITILPSNIKDKFNIVDEDLKNLTQKEIEIIDDKIEENKSYLQDLRRILKRTQFRNARKDKSSLDLKSLYAMAKQEWRLDSDFPAPNFLSNAALEEVKQLILHRCKSSVHGISRRKLKSPKDSSLGMGILSGSIVAELLREDAKINVFE